MPSLDEVGRKELMFPIPPDPVMIQLNQLQNQLRDKERELGAATCEIKGMKMTESLKDRALLELSDELKKMNEKLRTAENHLETKNLKIKRLTDEKKEAFAGQFAAEATLRRVHATQEDEDFFPLEAVIAPLASDIKKYKNEISILQEDKKALQRLIKSKEAALIEAEKILRSALERVLMLEDVQNQNLELRRQIEICQDENKYLNRIHRQKTVEVEKLAQTMHELKESLLAGEATDNVVRDYQRQVSKLNEEKRLLERELARLKVSVSRVATVVANEWKDDNDKVMPVKQWLEERKSLQGEIQRLRDKLVVSERSTKVEAQLKDKLQLRLKTLEEGLKRASGLSSIQAYSEINTGSLACIAGKIKQSISQTRTSLAAGNAPILKQINIETEGAESNRKTNQTKSSEINYVTAEILVKKNLPTSRSKICDENGKENAEIKVESNEQIHDVIPGVRKDFGNTFSDDESEVKCGLPENCQDAVSGFLYDKLQKEVIYIRKTMEEKEKLLNSKDDEVKMLLKKVSTLTKAMKIESKKTRREELAKKTENKESKTRNICKRC